MDRTPANRSWYSWFGALIVANLVLPAIHAEDAISKRLNSPRATVRTFLTSINSSRNNPRLIDLAVSCLDCSGLTANQKPSRLAFQLEAILREQDIDTDRIPDQTTEDNFQFPELLGKRISLKKQADGSWLFDRESVVLIPNLYSDAQKHIQEKNKEAASLNVSPEFASPRATFRTFLGSVRRGDSVRMLKSLDLREIPVAAREEVGKQLSHKLQQVIYRARMIIFQEMPDGNYSDPYIWVSQQEGVIELIRLPSGDQKGEWRFSRETIRSIDKLFDYYSSRPYTPELLSIASSSLKPDFVTAPELWLPSRLPGWMKATVFTTRTLHFQMYEVIGCFLLPFLGYLIYQLTTRLTGLIVALLTLRRRLEIPQTAILRKIRPLGRFLGVLAIRYGLLFLCIDTSILAGLLTILNPLLWLLGTWAAFRVIDLIGKLMETSVQDEKHRIEITQMLWPVSALATKIFLAVFALFNLMALFAWDVSTVLAGLGIGGVAFALGAQDSLKNLFGSFTLIADRPFLVGETVKIGEQDVGVVEVVGLRSTRIRTADDTLLIVPNSNLTTMNITNFGRRRYHRYSTTIGVIYTTPPEKLISFRNGISTIIRNHACTRKDKFDVSINDLNQGAVEILINVYFEISKQPREEEARDELILAILRLAEKLQIELSYPTHTLNLSHLNELNVRHLEPMRPGFHYTDSNPPPAPDSNPGNSKRGSSAA